jgi:hypothetical protein
MVDMSPRTSAIDSALGNEQLKLACEGNLVGDFSEKQSGRAGASGENRLAHLAAGYLVAIDCVLRACYVGGLIGLLTGCAVGPKYHPPSVQLQPFHNRVGDCAPRYLVDGLSGSRADTHHPART